MTDGRDVPRNDDGRLGRNWGPLDDGVRRAQLPSGCGIGEVLFRGFIEGDRLRRSARINSSCLLKLHRARGDGVKVFRSGPEGMEKGTSRALARSGVVCFGD